MVQNGMEVELKPAVIFEVALEEIQKSQSYHRICTSFQIGEGGMTSPEEVDSLREWNPYRVQEKE